MSNNETTFLHRSCCLLQVTSRFPKVPLRVGSGSNPSGEQREVAVAEAESGSGDEDFQKTPSFPFLVSLPLFTPRTVQAQLSFRGNETREQGARGGSGSDGRKRVRPTVVRSGAATGITPPLRVRKQSSDRSCTVTQTMTFLTQSHRFAVGCVTVFYCGTSIYDLTFKPTQKYACHRKCANILFSKTNTKWRESEGP